MLTLQTSQLNEYKISYTKNWACENYRRDGCRVCSQWNKNGIAWQVRSTVWTCLSAIRKSFYAVSWLLTKHGSITTRQKWKNRTYSKEGENGAIGRKGHGHRFLGFARHRHELMKNDPIWACIEQQQVLTSLHRFDNKAILNSVNKIITNAHQCVKLFVSSFFRLYWNNVEKILLLTPQEHKISIWSMRIHGICKDFYGIMWLLKTIKLIFFKWICKYCIYIHHLKNIVFQI